MLKFRYVFTVSFFAMGPSHGKQSLALVIRSLVVEPTHPGSMLRLGMGVCIYLDIFQYLTGAMLSVVGDVSVNSEASVVTSSTSRYAGSVPRRCS
jgi:hypothetical protein